MNVIEVVLAFDGKHVDELKLAADAVAAGDGPILIEFCSSDDRLHRIAASWIIKAHLDAGRDPGLDLDAFFSGLSTETDWAVLLHMLQTVQHMPIAARDHRQSVAALLDHKKTLVAVWALDALVRIALETGDGVEDARRRVAAALNHDKASMRARARHLAPLLGL